MKQSYNIFLETGYFRNIGIFQIYFDTNRILSFDMFTWIFLAMKKKDNAIEELFLGEKHYVIVSFFHFASSSYVLFNCHLECIL